MGETRDRAAMSIIAALRLGIPPEYGVERYSVARADITETFHDDLDAVLAGASALRYLSADYGQGKTHLLRLLRQQAFQRDFVVSIVELTGGSCPLFSLVDVYRQVMLGLRTAESPDESALELVLDRWLTFQRSAIPSDRERSLRRLPQDFQAALLAYLQAVNFLRPSPERRDSVFRWLTGERLSKRERDSLEVFESLGEATALGVLDAISDLFRDIGYGGVCILFDEAEGIASFARSAHRERAIANLFRIARSAESSVGCYFVYATTPSFADVVRDYAPFHAANADRRVLELAPLSPSEIRELVDRLRTVYEAAYAISIPDGVAGAVRDAAADGATSRVGDLTRSVVQAFDEFRG